MFAALSAFIAIYDEPGVSSLCLTNPFSIKSGISTAIQGPSYGRGGEGTGRFANVLNHPLIDISSPLLALPPFL